MKLRQLWLFVCAHWNMPTLILAPILQAICALIATGVVYRRLTQDDFVVWALIQSLTPFFLILTPNLANILSKYISMNGDRVNNLYRINFSKKIIIAISGLSLILCLIIICGYSILSSIEINYDLVFLICLYIILRVYSDSISGILYGIMKSGEDKLIKMSTSLIFIISIFYVENLADIKLNDIYSIFIVQASINIILQEYMIRSTASKNKKGRSIYCENKNQIKPVYKEIKNSITSNLPTLFINSSWVLFIGTLISVDELKNIQIGNQFAILLTVIASSVVMPFIAIIAIKAKYKGDDSLVTRFINSIIIFIFYICITYSMLIIFNINSIENLWLNGRTHMPLLYISLILIVQVVESMQIVFTASCLSLGFNNFFKINIISAFTNFIALFLFVKWLGMVGIPIAILLAQLLTCHQYSYRKYCELYNTKFKLNSSYLIRIIVYFIVLYAFFYYVELVIISELNKILICTLFASILFITFNIKNLKLLSLSLKGSDK